MEQPKEEKEVKESETASEEAKSEKEKETPSPSSSDETPEETPKETPEEEPEKEEIPSGQIQEPELKEVQGETPRERALRLQTTRLRMKLRQAKGEELFKGQETPKEAPKEVSEDKKKVLEKYQPEELQNLKEVFEVYADELGFVRKGEYETQSFQQQATDILDDFLESHKQYHPENDKDDVAWNAFKAEYEQYKQPKTPRGYKKIFEKVHKTLFGEEITPESELKTIEAQRQKTKVVSHSASSPNSQKIVENKITTSPLDPSLKKHLKGFSEEEEKEIFGE